MAVDKSKKKKSKGKKSSSKGEVTVDMGEAQSGGRLRVPEGDYKAKITDVTMTKSKNTGEDMVVIQFKGVDGKLKGKEFREYCVITGDSRGFGIGKLRSVMEAIGIDVPDSTTKVKFSKLVGKTVGVTMIDDEDKRDGKMRSVPGDYLDPDNVDDDDDDDDDEEDDSDDDDDDEDDEDDDDDDDDDDLDV